VGLDRFNCISYWKNDRRVFLAFGQQKLRTTSLNGQGGKKLMSSLEMYTIHSN